MDQQAKKLQSEFRDPQITKLVDTFKRFKPGQSFFIPDGTEDDLKILRRPFRLAGLGYSTCAFDTDPIYQSPGIRVWRELGAYDDQQTQ